MTLNNKLSMSSKITKGLYDPSFEHDSCGIGFVASLANKKSHDIVENALKMLSVMEHRGGCGCDINSGDGAGILIQKPHKFLVKEAKKLGIELPAYDQYGVGQTYFPQDKKLADEAKSLIEATATKLGLTVLGYRTVNKDNSSLGDAPKSTEPSIEQVFVQCPAGMDNLAFERKLFVLRNYTSHHFNQKHPELNGDFYYATFSSNTVGYKGQLNTAQVRKYFLDLHDEDVESTLALVHSRFSTNTFPKWKLAQPFRYIAHNGEINTVRGNVNWMTSRESTLSSDYFTDEELEMIKPLCDHSNSDSANLDNVIELLALSGRSLPHVMMMLVPEAWQEHQHMEDYKKDFYRYHAQVMEPWDGPASICFTDGKMVGATLDRNGLRPSRYILLEDGTLIMASEAGVIDVDPAKVVKRGRLQPGKIFVADLEQGKIIGDDELKKAISQQAPYGEWIKNEVNIKDLSSDKSEFKEFEEDTLLNRQQAFGYTAEDLKLVIAGLAEKATEPLGSMGTDAALPILSDQSQHLAHYFKQLFAQVTNPPIDPIREKLVMSLFSYIGRSRNVLKESADHSKKIRLNTPVLSNKEFNALKYIDKDGYKAAVLDIVFEASDKEGVLEKAVEEICQKAIETVKGDKVNILILSDRKITSKLAPIPSLLVTGAVHHALIKAGVRSRCGIVIEAGDVRETHHFATLIGYGAAAVNPYLAYETIKGLKNTGLIIGDASLEVLEQNFIKAIGYGLRKIFSKMGISTLQSYQGAQIFEALGICQSVVDKCFIGTVTRIEGLTFDGIAKEVLVRHHLAYPATPNPATKLEVGGDYQWKRRGEYHLFNPDSIQFLQQSTKNNDYQLFKKYTKVINNQTKKAATLRGLLEFTNQNPIPLSEVESVESIFKRFATGAMSFGSISHEAHSTLAIAMNRIGGKSNSGEGGEDPIRFFPKKNGDWERSAIKQVASGRFGVTSYYLTNADELQIKMAQGAKPGEGGQLPGHKVDDWIGKTRHSTPGVGLISPPPHHDIYSIEDLAQLIFDLKNANRKARINVKLVSEAGVGTVATGVAKAYADVVLIAGHDGGTGASPISSIKHAGLPWELGLSETHQTLVKNKLRSRIVVQADGQMKTGRDIAIATLLGAEEWGVATAALVVEGCIMMRKCHLNTCPVGIATQNKELRKRYTGNPDHVVNFFRFMAEDLREIMAELGFRTIAEMVGQVDKLKVREGITHWKYKNLDLSRILFKEENDPSETLYQSKFQEHHINDVLDLKMIQAADASLKKGEKTKAEFKIINTDRSCGTMLSNEISKRYKGEGLPDDTIKFKFRGSAGQSFGGFSAKGLTLELEGESNDYFGKGLSGAKLILYPFKETNYNPSENIIVGNVCFYGATSGEAYIRGLAGERFCVRNSGAKAVVEGVGDHGLEYMTGGIAVILGETGRNFAAGMSGGVAYVYDKNGTFESNCNRELVDFDTFDSDDLKELRRLIQNHYDYTQSDVAQEILVNWDTKITKFIKVMPRDYKAVLLKKKIESLDANKKEVGVNG
jgi:glutamate synthase (NADPH) large chain